MSVQQLEYSLLDWSARPGFYIAEGNARYWVFNSFRGKYAVRLDCSIEVPQFTAIQLNGNAVATGAWLGMVKVDPGAEAHDSFRGRVGLLGTSGLRWFI